MVGRFGAAGGLLLQREGEQRRERGDGGRRREVTSWWQAQLEATCQRGLPSLPACRRHLSSPTSGACHGATGDRHRPFCRDEGDRSSRPRGSGGLRWGQKGGSKPCHGHHELPTPLPTEGFRTSEASGSSEKLSPSRGSSPGGRRPPQAPSGGPDAGGESLPPGTRGACRNGVSYLGTPGGMPGGMRAGRDGI